MTPLGTLRVPEELSARVPAEQRGGPGGGPGPRTGPGAAGPGRDAVRLLVGGRGTGEITHHLFRDLPSLLRPGDVLVVNTSPTLPAAVDGTTGTGEPVVVHFSTRQDDGRWAVELRTPRPGGATGPRPGGPAGTVVELPGGERLVLAGPLDPAGTRLWVASVSTADPVAFLHRHGRPIRYAYTERDQPLSVYTTVFALPSPGGGSAEMPSAGRPFTEHLVTELVSRGVQVAPVTLHAGVASAGAHEPPYPERFTVPESTARLVNAARAGGARVLAIGTTAVRALETAATARGTTVAACGWTDLVVTPGRGVRVVDGLLTGLHEPEASHLLMLEAVAGEALLPRVYTEAVAERYLWHEFGDVNLLLP